jgi:hypothetical protein
MPLRILEKLKRITQELDREKGIKISPNQLAMKLIDNGLNDEKVLKSIFRESPPLDMVVQVPANNNHIREKTTTASANIPTPEGGDLSGR